MAEENRNSGSDKNGKRNGGNDFRVPSRTVLVWVGIIGLITVIFMFRNQQEQKPDTFNYYAQLEEKLTNNLIVPGTGKVTFVAQSPDMRRISGKYFKVEKDGKKSEVSFVLETPLTDALATPLLRSGMFQFVQPNSVMLNIFLQVFPFLLILAVIYFFL